VWCSGWFLGCFYVVCMVFWVVSRVCSGWFLGCFYVVVKVFWVVPRLFLCSC